MPGRVRSFEEFSDLEEPQYEPNKRIRYITEGQNVRLSDGQITCGTKQPQKHQPGAIVRVTLKDFVTYSNATFYPGPSLNMVIGPNGTGKSTLVCAICLGLGWAPKHLGRAKDVVEFIKHGQSTAVIEIELKGSQERPNPIIRRQIDHNKSSTHWWINNQASNEKNAKAVAESFNIQIDNLCQFLPQDRVAEFANLKPVEKLTATIRAAAPQEMINQHEQLKHLRVRQGSAEKDLGDQKQKLADNERKQESQRQDVEKIRERQQAIEDRDLLRKQQGIADYLATRDKYKAYQTNLKEAQSDLAGFEREVEPRTRKTKEKEQYRDQIDAVVNDRKKLLRGLERQMDGTSKQWHEFEGRIEDLAKKRDAEKNARKTRGKQIANVKASIEGLEKSRQNAPPAFDAADYNERSRAKRRNIQALETSETELREAKIELTRNLNEKRKAGLDAERNIQSLQTEAGQRETLLRSASEHTYRAWKWLREYQTSGEPSMFIDKVYGPPLLECSINDDSWANVVESLIRSGEMTAITVTNSQDMNKLSDHLHSEMKLPNVPLRTASQPLDSWRPPLDDGEKRRLGISGWALDKLSGPDVLLSMLCQQSGIHKTALLDSDPTGDHFEQLADAEQLPGWFSRQKSTTVKRRKEYGAKSVATRNIDQAKYWVSQPVDMAAINNMNDDIAGWKTEEEEIQKQIEQGDGKRSNIHGQIKTMEAEHKKLNDEKDDIQRKLTAFYGLPKKIETKQAEVDALEEKDRQQVQDIDNLEREKAELSLEWARVALRHSHLLTTFRGQHVEVITASIAHLEAQSDVETLKAKNLEVERLLANRRTEVQDLDKETKAIKAEATRLADAWKKMQKADPQFAEYFSNLSKELRERSPEEIFDLIEQANARLDLLDGGSEHIVQEFEAREVQIDRLRRTIADHDTAMSELNEQITTIRSDWEPKLDSLISQISEAFGAFFNKIRCAGEVSVYKAGPTEGRDDDFENWAIMLKVKFRENEELSVLDSHRQSGGERAVSTMFYLMALQRLSRAPFRVVDEINQGMDPRNERIVHGLMVDIACGNPEDETDDFFTGGSQYFLVTPKLLTGLKYARGMKVHCINSGEFMPEDPGKLDLKALIRRAAEVRARMARDAARGENGKQRVVAGMHEEEGAESGMLELDVDA